MVKSTDRLHEKDEPRFAPGKLYSMLDLMVGATATCDSCGRWQRLPVLLESEMKDAAAKRGWIVVDSKDLCPLCAQTKTPLAG